MPIHLDVLTQLDERAVAANTRSLIDTFSRAGRDAGLGFGAAIHDELQRSGVSRGEAIGNAMGMAIGRGLLVGVGAATTLIASMAAIGETFENINRGIITTTAATGTALDQLTSRADAMVGSLDTSINQLGTDMGTLASRLNTGASPALDSLTRNVEMLRDRFGSLDINSVAGMFREYGVSVDQADATLASLLHTSQSYGVALPTIVNDVSRFGATLTDLGLNAEQAARMLADLEARGLNVSQSVMGLEMAEKAAATAGQDLPTFLRRAVDSMEYYAATGQKVKADEIAMLVFGARRWQQARDAAREYIDVVNAGPDAYKRNADELTKFQEDTATLRNHWQQLRNTIEGALAPAGITVVDTIAEKMQGFLGWLNSHQDDLRAFFSTAVDTVFTLIERLGEVASWLGRHETLVKSVAAAFALWEGIKGITSVITTLQTINTLLEAIPGKAAAAGGAMGAMGAGGAGGGGGPVVIPGGGAPSGPGPGMFPGWLKTLPLFGVGAQQDVWQMPLPDNASPLERKRYEDAKARGDQHAAELVYMEVYNRHGAPAPGQPGSAAAAGPANVMPPGMAPPPYTPAPGMAPMVWVPGQGYVSTAPTAPGAAPPGLLTPDDLQPGRKGKGPRLPAEPQLPYPAGYGEPPYPGETAEQYRHRQKLLEDQHNLAMDQARIDQLMQDHNATADDIQKAKNKLLRDEQQYYEDQMSTTRKHTAALESFGAKIDEDFGISKGLPGIAENIVKFIGNLTMAGPLAALSSMVESSGAGKSGAGGLLGMAAVSGAFGPQYVPGGLGGGTGAGGAGAGGATMLGAGMGGPGFAGLPSPASMAAIAKAQSMVGLPYAPGTSDCSGYVSQVYGAMVGTPTHFTTESFNGPALGFRPTTQVIPGALNVGILHGGPGGGHMAATLPNGVNIESGGRLGGGPKYGGGAAGAMDSQFTEHWVYAPGFATGGPVPIVAHGGEWVIQKSAVDHYGPNFMAAINARTFQGGGEVNIHDQPQQGPTRIGGTTPNPGIGSGLPGGGVASGAVGQVLGGATPSAGIGGGMSAVGGGLAAGAAAGAGTMGIGLAAQIAMQEIQRAIQFGGQMAGIGIEGLMQTFLPAGASELAQNSWLTRIGGALAGARPALPNIAAMNPSSGGPAMPSVASVPPPLLTATAAPGGWGPGAGPIQGPGLSPGGIGASAGRAMRPTAEALMGPPGAVAPAGAAGQGRTAPVVHIEHYEVNHTEDRAGADLARHSMAAAGIPGER